MVPGVATLDRSPDQSPGVRPISPSTGTEGNQEGWPSWVEYRSGGTGGPHPGVDIFPDLSPRAKPYCGVKCQIWVVTNHQYGISKLIPKTSFRNETSDGFTECRLFSQAQLLRAHWSRMWEISILLRSNDHGN